MADGRRDVEALARLKGQGALGLPGLLASVSASWGKGGSDPPKFPSTASPPQSPNLHCHLRGCLFPFLQAGVSPEIRQLFT